MSEVNIVGFYSPSSGHGKDTMAKVLLNNTLTIPEEYRLGWGEILGNKRPEILLYSHWNVKKFALGPKKIVADMYNVPVEMMEDREWRLKVHAPFEISPLAMIIKISQGMKTMIGEDVWKDILFNQYKEGEKWLITDVRFPCEYEEIKRRRGIVIKVERTDCNEPKQAMDGLLDDYEFDDIITNDFGLWSQAIQKVKSIIVKYNLGLTGEGVKEENL